MRREYIEHNKTLVLINMFLNKLFSFIIDTYMKASFNNTLVEKQYISMLQLVLVDICDI